MADAVAFTAIVYKSGKLQTMVAVLVAEGAKGELRSHIGDLVVGKSLGGTR
jgi:hypothetical protein